MYILNLVPYKLRVASFSSLISLCSSCFSRLRKPALINLEIAYPELNHQQHKSILNQSCKAWGRVLTETFRLHTLSDQWFIENIEFPNCKEIEELEQNSKKGILMLTAHLSCFEFLPRRVSLVTKTPSAFVARNLKPQGLNQWWLKQRTSKGNIFIPRKGAIKKVAEYIANGQNVGLLVDQNVVRHQAIFVDWFGRSAATTKAISTVAIETECPIVVLAVQSLPNGKYRVNSIIKDYSDLYNDPDLNYENKRYLITERASKDLQELIKLAPEEWLWFHKRWKTAAIPGEGESLYKNV